LRPGIAQPLGATALSQGVNFAVYSRHGTKCTLVLHEGGVDEPFAERGWTVSSSWHKMYGWSSRTLLDQRRLGWSPDVTIREPTGSLPAGFMMRQLAPHTWRGCAGQAASAVQPAELLQVRGGKLEAAWCVRAVGTRHRSPLGQFSTKREPL